MVYKLSHKGFSVIEAAIVLVVVAGLGLGGWYVWHKHNGSKKNHAASNTTSSSSKQLTPSAQGTGSDVYARWKTYKDTLYGYSLRYPADWKIDIGIAPERACEAGQTTITSADGTVIVNYTNDNNHDGNIEAIHPVSIEKLFVSGQDATVIGSYTRSGSAYYPSYAVADTAWISAHPLTIGQASQFPAPAEFSDQNTESLTCTGSLMAQSTAPITSEADAKAWFTTNSAKESLLIIKSLNYTK